KRRQGASSLQPDGTDATFFFASRRRHTRSYGDWSSDVCSSDLHSLCLAERFIASICCRCRRSLVTPYVAPRASIRADQAMAIQRSEERRVGKEGRGGGGRVK